MMAKRGVSSPLGFDRTHVKNHWSNCCKETTTKETKNKKRLACSKKHEQWTLDWWKFGLWSDEFKVEIFGYNHCVFVRRRVCEQISLRMCGSHRDAWRRRCGGALLVTLSGVYLEFKAHLTSMATTSILQQYTIPFGLRVVGLLFVFQQENDQNTPPGV